MNKNSRYFNIIIFAVCMFLYLLVEFGPTIGKSVTIDSYDAEVTFDLQGDMTVVERWEMDYHEDMRVRFRDIQYNKYASNYPLYYDKNNLASFVSDSVDVEFYKNEIDKTAFIRVGLSSRGEYDELGYPIECPDQTFVCESIFVDANSAGRLDGKVTFIYTYTINGVITKYSDISEFNWRLFEYAEGNIKEASIRVNLPSNSFDVNNFYAWGHGLSQGYINIVNNQTIEVTMSNIKNGEFPELRILMPKALFTSVREQNIVIHPDMNFQRLYDYEIELIETTNRRILIAKVIFFGSYGLIALMGLVSFRIYLKHDKEYEPDFQGDFYRELPNEATPAEVSYLYYTKSIQDEVFTATLLDLIRRGYIKIVNDFKNPSKSQSKLSFSRSKVENEDQLLSHEKVFLYMIFDMIGSKTETSTDRIEQFTSSYENANTFKDKSSQFTREAKKVAEKQHYFESLHHEKSMIRKISLIPYGYFGLSVIFWIFFSIDTFFAMGISIAIGTLFLIYIHKFQRRSKQGNELYTKWKAFRNFLINFSSMEDYPIPSIIIWEHYLIYATVFKLADEVMEQLRVKLPKETFEQSESTYLAYGYRRYGSNFYHIHRSFTNSFQHAKTNAVRSIARHNQNQVRSGGRGGGFSGGSSFGGGGGGGRSR
jgi:uncharacterized membrane protein